MIYKALTLIAAISLFSACTSSLPDPETIPEGRHKTRAMSLLQRNPKDDASAFFNSGGVGYHMTSGGLRMPIAVRGEAAWRSGDFESLKPFDPMLYSQINPLLADAEAPLTMRHYMGEIPLSEERQFYYDIRNDYVTKFNRRMESFDKYKNANKLEMATPRKPSD